jgi:hypothetical protein
MVWYGMVVHYFYSVRYGIVHTVPVTCCEYHHHTTAMDGMVEFLARLSFENVETSYTSPRKFPASTPPPIRHHLAAGTISSVWYRILTSFIMVVAWYVSASIPYTLLVLYALTHQWYGI